MNLTNKVAIITGGVQGIGGAIASRFAEAGAAVMMADIDAEKSRQKVRQMANEQAQFTSCDVADPDQVARLFEATLKAFGRLDILVNNAAVVHHPAANRHFLEIPAEIWHKVVAVNLSGLFYCTQRAAQIMVRQGQGGSIISMSSGGATRAHPHMMPYDTTKGGIEAATRAIALELAPWNIRVNAIAPGNITVANSLTVGSIAPDAAANTIPLGHPGQPADIAAAALYLASAEAAYITGTCLFVDGGMNAQLRSPGVDTKPDAALVDRLGNQ